MALPLLMAGISAATSIAGGIINSREANNNARKQQAMIDRQRAENDAWYNRRYFEDGTQRADVRRILTEAGNRLQRSNQAAAGTAAVMGGTNAEAAATKEANNQVYADMVGQAAAQADARKDSVESSYRQQDQTIAQQQMALDNQRSEAKQNAVKDAVQSVNKVAEAAVASADPVGGVKKSAGGNGAIGAVGNNSAGVVAGKAGLAGKIAGNVKRYASNGTDGSSTEAWVARQNGKINKLV